MALDASLILGFKHPEFENPANQLAKLLQVQEMQQLGRVREMQMQDAQEAKANQNRLTSLLSQYGDAPDLPEQLTKSGFIDQANTVRKNRTEAQNAQATLDKNKFDQAQKRLEIMGQTFGYVRQNPTPQNAFAAIQFLAQNGIMTPEQAQQAAAQIEADPSKVGQLADMAFRSVLSAQQQLPKIEVRDTGGAVQTLQIDPVTGRQDTTATIQKTQSPDSIATDRRFASSNVQPTEAPPKPMPPTALKMQNEALEALGIASNIDTDLGAIETQISAGKLDFGPVSNLINAGKNMAGMSDEKSRNFATFKSTLEKLRNDSLRLNAGVQTEGDAQRAWNELFQNINDTELVKQRLAEIRAINRRASDLQRLKVDNVRSNYGYAPYEFDRVTNQPAVPGAKSAQEDKVMTMADVQATAKRSGRSVQEVINAAKAKGYTVR